MDARLLFRSAISTALMVLAQSVSYCCCAQDLGYAIASEPNYSIASDPVGIGQQGAPGLLNQGGVNSSFGQNMTEDLAAGTSGLQSAAGAANPGGSGDEDLATKLVDPTASVTVLNFQNRYVSSFYGSPDQQNTMVFQPVIPYKAFGTNHILRATMPYRLDGPYRDGLDPITLFDLFVLPASWGRMAFGPVVSLSPNYQNGRDTIQAGPAAGFVARKGKWTYGAFNQNLMSSDTTLSFLQPVLAYTINPKWTISAGDLQQGYDWKSDQWINLPVGFQVGRLVQIGKTTLRLSYNPQYNFRELDLNPEWTHVFGVGLVVK